MSTKTDTSLPGNLPLAPLLWSLTHVRTEFGLNKTSLQDALRAAKIKKTEQDTITTSEIMETLFGTFARARLEEVKARTTWFQLRNQKLSGSLLDAQATSDQLDLILSAVKSTIMNLNLSLEDKKNILSSLSDLPHLVFRQQEAQQEAGASINPDPRGNGNGDSTLDEDGQSPEDPVPLSTKPNTSQKRKTP